MMKESMPSMGACGQRWWPLAEQGEVAAPTQTRGTGDVWPGGELSVVGFGTLGRGCSWACGR
jgi:hypothetical protein